ncbi:MAG: response regulator [Gammaproteobacteria bacterium]
MSGHDSRQKPTVFIVDDDEAARESLTLVAKSDGLHAEAFDSAESFLECYQPGRPGCLVLDIRMPGLSGLELQQQLKQRHIDLPIIFVTGHGDVPIAVRALKAGAIDFFEKPYDVWSLLKRIRDCMRHEEQRLDCVEPGRLPTHKLAELTPRERQIMDLMVEGHSNKIIARRLGISVRTVEVHRANLMDKLDARSLADVVHLALQSRQRSP